MRRSSTSRPSAGPLWSGPDAERIPRISAPSTGGGSNQGGEVTGAVIVLGAPGPSLGQGKAVTISRAAHPSPGWNSARREQPVSGITSCTTVPTAGCRWPGTGAEYCNNVHARTYAWARSLRNAPRITQDTPGGRLSYCGHTPHCGFEERPPATICVGLSDVGRRKPTAWLPLWGAVCLQLSW